MMMKNIRSLIAPVIAALLAVGVAQAAVWQWSPTAATNATADATINWAEGMSPSSVNDSARAMMSRIANWRDDFSGLLGTGGTSTAFTVTTNQGFNATPTTGQLVSLTPHATNGASATLAADGGTAFPIQTAPGAAVAAGVLVLGTPYDLKFSGTAWILKNFYANPFNVPLGAVLDYTGTTAPNSNFVLANGQCISRTTYATYFSLVSTTFGVCDGLTTFGVPDLANRVVAGLQMGGTARITVAGGNFDGNTLGATGGVQNWTLTIAQLPAHTPAGTINQVTGTISQITPAGSISGSVGISDPTHSHPYDATIGLFAAGVNPALIALNSGLPNFHHGNVDAVATGITASLSASFSGTPVTPTFTGSTPTFTGTSIGSSSSHPIMPPTMVLSKIVRIF